MLKTKYINKLHVLLVLIFLCGFTTQVEKTPHVYRVANHEIEDSYDWLRDRNWPEVTDPKVLNFLAQENSYADKNLFTKYKKERDQIFNELQHRIKFAHTSEYTKKDDYYYYTRTEEEKNYKIHCRKKASIEAEEEIILDENLVAKDSKFMQLSTVVVSDDHKFLTYAVDFAGNEIFTIKILDLTNKQYLKDEIPNVSLSDSPAGIIWHKNGSGFFYMPASSRLFPDKVMFHKLGDDYKNDKLIYFEPDKEFSLVITRSQDQRFLFINSFAGCFNEIYQHVNRIDGRSNEIHFIDLESNSLQPKLIQAREEQLLYAVEHHNNNFYIITNDVGNNFRMVKTPVVTLSKNKWQEFLPLLPDHYLESFDISKNYLIVNYKHQGLPVIKVINLSNNKIQDIKFSSPSYMAVGYVANFVEDELRIFYSSLNTPDTIYKYDFSKNLVGILKQKDSLNQFQSNEYIVKRQWADNHGIKVPISILYKKSLFKQDGTNPLYLYGYGAYGSEVLQNFRAELIPLVDKGVVFAIAHCRGGNELGEHWYIDGKLLNKKNTFADFIACSEHLIKYRYTSKDKLIISGRSAGGTLIGAVINGRPELYKAAIMHAPFVDVLNTMLDDSMAFTITDYPEFGNPRKLGVFNYANSNMKCNLPS
jgi:oligopeptidase B